MAIRTHSKAGSFDERERNPLQGARRNESQGTLGGFEYRAALAGLMLPAMLNHFSVSDEARVRRLDIAALAVLVLCNLSILLVLRMKRRRAEKSLPWITWKGGRPAPSNDHTAANRALLQWGVLAAAGLLGASYSWITGQWVILPLFLIGGYWIGTRARELIHH